MDKKITKGPRVRQHATGPQPIRTWHELTDRERDELLSPAQRRTLRLGFFGWEHRYVRASVAANMLGVSAAQFRKLGRELKIYRLSPKGQRLFLVRDVLLIKSDLPGVATGVR
ncbi:hypothetical protein X750_05225 [Mesorhizobium sp. LNJC394B00]|nr:hypothetical protein X750_05225 [Mesorhizobium sp. LNJC394B00]